MAVVVLEHALVVTPVTARVVNPWPSHHVVGRTATDGTYPPARGCRPGTGAEKEDTLTIALRENIQVSYTFSGDEASVKYAWSGWTRNGRIALSEAASRPVKQAVTASSTAEPRKRRITTEQEYRDAIVGKKFVGEDGYFATHKNGKLTGSYRGKKLIGKWNWKGKFFCRTGKLDGKKIRPACHAIFVKGDTMIGVREKGKGGQYVYRLQKPDS